MPLGFVGATARRPSPRWRESCRTTRGSVGSCSIARAARTLQGRAHQRPLGADAVLTADKVPHAPLPPEPVLAPPPGRRPASRRMIAARMPLLRRRATSGRSAFTRLAVGAPSRDCSRSAFTRLAVGAPSGAIGGGRLGRSLSGVAAPLNSTGTAARRSRAARRCCHHQSERRCDVREPRAVEHHPRAASTRCVIGNLRDRLASGCAPPVRPGAGEDHHRPGEQVEQAVRELLATGAHRHEEADADKAGRPHRNTSASSACEPYIASPSPGRSGRTPAG